MKTSRLSVAQRRILSQLQAMHREERPLNISYVKRHYPRLIKRVYAIKPYWGWKQALHDAGLSYDGIRTFIHDDVTCRLCGYTASSLVSHLNFEHEVAPPDYRRKFPGSDVMSDLARSRMMGHSRVKKSLPPSKLRLPQWEQDYSPEYILDRIWEYHRNGIGPNCQAVLDVDVSLVATANKLFGSWDNALEKLGIDPLRTRRHIPDAMWTKDLVIRELKRFHSAYPGMRYMHLSRSGHKSLCRAATRCFGGSWKKALLAAGFEKEANLPRSPSRFGPKDKARMLGVIRRTTAIKDPIKRTRVIIEVKATYLKVLTRFFGYRNWGLACEAAGVPNALFQPLQVKYLSHQDVLKAIRHRKNAGLGLRLIEVRYTTPDIALYNRSRQLFGTWAIAVSTALTPRHRKKRR